MLEKYYRRKCCLTSVCPNIVKQRRHISSAIWYTVFCWQLWGKDHLTIGLLAQELLRIIILICAAVFALFFRDHYGNKRLDLAGPLLGTLFRQLFKKLNKDVKTYLQKAIDADKELNLMMAVKSKTM